MDKGQLKIFMSDPRCTLVEAMQKIDENSRGILFITDENQRLIGVLTDGDIRRWIIQTGNLNVSVGQMMNQNPKKIHCMEMSRAKEYMLHCMVTALPVIDDAGVIKEIIFKDPASKKAGEYSKTLSNVPVIIMAGGKGTRLYPYTKILPKPLIPIGDIPIMERIIDCFHLFGICNFYITVNYRKNMIKSYFAELQGEYKMHYIEEEKPLGTAGSLRLINEDFSAPVIITNCDILIDEDYERIYNYHYQTGNELTIVAALKNIIVPYGVIHSKENGAVESMDEKPKISHFVNTGMYIMNPDLIKEIPENTFFHMTDLVDSLLAAGRRVGMYPISEDSFLDMGELEEMHRMEEKLNLKTM